MLIIRIPPIWVFLVTTFSTPLVANGAGAWTNVGYRGDSTLPGDGSITKDRNCIITASQLQGPPYNVIPNDGRDDSVGIQSAIDTIRSRCSTTGDYSRLSLIELPEGTLHTSTELHLDADFLVLRGQGNDPTRSSSTKIEFQPGADTVYDGISDFELGDMKGGGSSNGGWIWPGRGAFRVQTRAVHESYAGDYNNAAENRKDFYEGSVNFHWKSGLGLARDAFKGETKLHIRAGADMGRFSAGSHVWVAAANSHKMYDRQGVQSKDRKRDYMRQQIFVVTHVNTASDIITIDKPLEFDVLVSSTSDGSPEISGSGSKNKSKIVPLTIVRGVGLENFYLTQIVPRLDAWDATFNYNNIAKEHAMHGIVFKWAVDCYVKDVRTYMTGSHPIVTEIAKNLQIEGNYLEGSWNKGKGGNGYFRNSKLWDSLIVNTTTKGLRHLTLQWSASGNVVRQNTLDSDINLHGGWERNNLIEENVVKVPYQHRDSADETWYPIWWAAGHHAGGWSGASGPRNVFFNNILTKQLTPNGPDVEYAPYGSDPHTVFQFGWDHDSLSGSHWEHLSLNGADIESWNGQETNNFQTGANTAGVNANCAYSGSSLIGASVQCGQQGTWDLFYDKRPAAPGSCDAIAGCVAEAGIPLASVPVEKGVVECEMECMSRKSCVSFVLDTIGEVGNCNLFSSDSHNYTVGHGGDNTYGNCGRPTDETLDTFPLYIINAGVGGYLSSRDINPLIKRDGNAWEKWNIEKSSGDASKYVIKDYRGRYLSAQRSGLVEYRTWIGSWEEWDIQRLPGSFDVVTIKGIHGMYLKAENSGWVFANAVDANDWEGWKITNNNDLKGSGPDGEWVIGGSIAVAVLAVAAVATGGVAGLALGPAATLLGVSLSASTAVWSTMAFFVTSGLLGFGGAIINYGMAIDGEATRIVTSGAAFAALFE